MLNAEFAQNGQVCCLLRCLGYRQHASTNPRLETKKSPISFAQVLFFFNFLISLINYIVSDYIYSLRFLSSFCGSVFRTAKIILNCVSVFCGFRERVISIHLLDKADSLLFTLT